MGRFLNTSTDPGRFVSPEDKLKQVQQDTIAPSGVGGLPSDQGLTPQAAPIQALSPPDPARPVDIGEELYSPPPGGVNSVADLLASIGKGAPAAAPASVSLAPVAAAAPVGPEPQYAEPSKGRRQLSPLADVVRNEPVVKATTGLSENKALFEDEFETDIQKGLRYEAEQKRQTPLTIDEILSTISDIDDQTEFAFDNVATKLTQSLDREVFQTPRIAEALGNIGLVDRETGKVNQVASRASLFALAKRGRDTDKKKSEEVKALQTKFAGGEITESLIDKSLRDVVLTPDFDGDSLQSSLANEFEAVFRGGGEQSVDKDGRIIDTDFGLSNAAGADQTLFAATMVNAMQDAKFIEPVRRVIDGEVREGFMMTDKFKEMMKTITVPLEDYDISLKKNVTFTPNVGGQPSGQQGLIYKQQTRSLKGQRLDKGIKPDEGGRIWDALNAMGTTGNGVNLSALGANAIILDSVFSLVSKDGYYSTHPMAESFRMGFNTFAKYLKDPDVSSAAEFDAKRKQLQDAAATSFDKADPAFQAMVAFDSRIRVAADTSKKVANNYIRALVEGAKLNGRTFYHTYTLIAGTSRPMVSTTEFNYQANKKARALTSNPREKLVKPKEPNSKATRGLRLILARNLVEDADRAPNSKALLRMFDEKMMKDDELKSLAVWANNQFSADRETVNAYAKDVDRYYQAEHLYADKPADVFPGRDRNAPTFAAKKLDAGNPRVLELAKFMGLMKDGVQAKSDEADFKLQALMNFGKYLEGKPFLTQLTAEADGISNGLVIQSYQFGINSIAERGGLLYDGSENVTPKGDMRDLLHATIVGDVDSAGTAPEGIFPDGIDADKWATLYSALIGGNKGMIKALHKAPVMTTPYGLDADYHYGAIEDFLDEQPKIAKEFMSQTGLDNEGLVEVMVKIEAAALKKALGGAVDHQAIVKNAHNAAVAAGELWSVEGPNGWDIVSGGKEYEETGTETVTFANGQTVDLITTRAVATPHTAKKPRDSAWKPKLGSQGQNQSAVFGTQNIDASVVQEGFTQSKKDVGDLFWGGQVYDAVLGDVDSYEIMVDNMNSKFDSINRRYNMVEAEIAALKKIKKAVADKVADAKKNGYKFDVTEEGEYKGMFNMLKTLSYQQKQADKGQVGRRLRGSERRASRDKSIRLGFSFDGEQMTPDQFQAAFEHMLESLQIDSRLRTFQLSVNKAREQLRRDMDEQQGGTAQYR